MSASGTIEATDSGTHTEQFCTFYIGDVLLGIEVMLVQEVLLSTNMTPMPLTSDVVRGLINLRGQIVTAIDLGRRLGLPTSTSDREPMHVVVRNGDTAFSLLVDEIGAVVTVDSQSFEPTPETLTGPARELTSGVFKLEQGLLLALDSRQATTITEQTTDQ